MFSQKSYDLISSIAKPKIHLHHPIIVVGYDKVLVAASLIWKVFLPSLGVIAAY
jgi:hypothetical protein